MKLGIAKSMIMVGMAALFLATSSVVFAWVRPTSPDYTTDFTSNQNCLTPTGTSPGYPGFPCNDPALLPPGVTNGCELPRMPKIQRGRGMVQHAAAGERCFFQILLRFS